ncbi:hypothetical protein OCL88_01655 [Paenarthrobacter sp. PAE-2]|uniref:hypothetical protein n=1 Tax=Paenarthrobacter sp. PAE-2 TaxID=2982532 RepID=UPI0022308106|nr:hypothetical protein [Paenarthrobacter sp. PAE-2]MCW3765165.1 hypothetical protein [Paenarthrobacter sp. PAE-2]
MSRILDSSFVRFLRSPRGLLGLGIFFLLVIGGVLHLAGLGSLGIFLVVLGVALAIPVLFEGTHTIRRSLTVLRQGVRKSEEQARAAASAARNQPAPDNRARLDHAELNKLVSVVSQPKQAAAAPDVQLEQIRDWVGMSRSSNGRNLSVAAANGIFEAIKSHLPSTAVHIGSAVSTAWVANCLSRLQAKPSFAAGLVDSTEELAAFKSMEGLALSADKATCQQLPVAPTPAASLAGITAHTVDMVVIDFGGIANKASVQDNIPERYFTWLRPNTPVVIVDSSAIDVRPAVEEFLAAHPRFYVKKISASLSHAELIGM